MNCRGFEVWLDAGRPEDSAAAEHAAQCSACADRLRGADDLVSTLAQRFATAPAGFTDRVMSSLLPRTADVPLQVPEDRESPWPWWIRIVFEPQAALGLALALLYGLTAPTLIDAGREAAPHLTTRLGAVAAALPEATWLPAYGQAIVLSAILAVGSIGLFQGSVLLFSRLTRLRVR